jgi:hypothetical protein
MAQITDIADAVVAALNGQTFSQPVTAERAYRAAFDLQEMKDLRVTVVPKGLELITAGRGVAQSDVQIDIGVQKKLTTGDDVEIDELMGLVQEIVEFVRATRQFGDAVWVKTENTPIYSQEHLGELRQFTSVLTLTLRVMTS